MNNLISDKFVEESRKNNPEGQWRKSYGKIKSLRNPGVRLWNPILHKDLWLGNTPGRNWFYCYISSVEKGID